MDDVVFLVDRNSFPVHCDELDDFIGLMSGASYDVELYESDSPTLVLNRCLEACSDYDLVVPVTRNFFVRDRLRQEGVNFIICL